MTDEALSPKFTAAIDLLQRTGMRQFRIGHSDEDDGAPIIWHATAIYGTIGTEIAFQVAAGHNPEMALMRLCEQTIDGAECTHCKKGTIFEHIDINFDEVVAQFGLDACVYAWDPELKVFRRGCE